MRNLYGFFCEFLGMIILHLVFILISYYYNWFMQQLIAFN